MPDNFFALLQDGSLRKIPLLQKFEPNIRTTFLNYGSLLKKNKTEVKFDGNYAIEDDEIFFVPMTLPSAFEHVPTNSIGIAVLNLRTDEIKALFWYEDNNYYFQNFDRRKMLRQKNVLFFSNQTFTRLTEDAFVIDSSVNGLYQNGKFYFSSYANANKIFSLLSYYEEATDEVLQKFSNTNKIAIMDVAWFLENSNSVVRKYVTFLTNSKLLNTADTKKIKRNAAKFKLNIELDRNGSIIFPTDRNHCKNILIYLNEQVYEGPISKKQFITSSKKPLH